MTQRFNIRGSIIPKERPRFDTRNGRVYTPTKTKNWENDIRKQLAGPKQFTGPVEVRMCFMLNKKNYARMDLDNLAKCPLDAMNKVCYVDDRQVVSLILRKQVCDAEEVVIVEVEEIL